LPQRSIYDALEDAGVSYRSYYEQISTALLFKKARSSPVVEHIKSMKHFYADAKAGTLPSFSWIDPQYFPMFCTPANDQHPSHSVAEGERLVKSVYEAVRASPQWNETLLIITYDEHGGFYDHVPTPLNVPNPDGLHGVNADGSDAFSFDRLGVRVPTVMVSPWIKRGTVVSKPSKGNSHFEHTSTLATVKHLFGLPSFLTKRDAWAAPYNHLWTTTAARRSDADCPHRLPPAPRTAAEQRKHAAAEFAAPLNDLQRDYVHYACGITGACEMRDALLAFDAASRAGIDADSLTAMRMTQGDAGSYVKTAVCTFLGSCDE
jgi:phospholipase C